MRKLKTIQEPERKCFYCFFFPLDKEFTTEMVKRCAEHWLDAENCLNWKPFRLFIKRRWKMKFKRIKMIKRLKE